MSNEQNNAAAPVTTPSNAIAKGTLFKVHMKHGSWWSEMTRGAVLEAKQDGAFGAPMEFSHYGWADGNMVLTPVAEVTKKGVKIQLVSAYSRDGKKRALTVLAYSREEMQADRAKRFGRGASAE